MRSLRMIAAIVLVAACSPTADPITTTTTAAPSTSSTVPPTSTSSSGPESTTSTTATSTTASLPPLVGLEYEVVAEGLGFPMLIMPWTADTSLVGFRDGRIHRFDGDSIDPEPLVDLAVSTDGERGLLGFDTDGADVVYVHYSDPNGDTAVSAVDLTTGGERVLLQVAQPASNHNGGMLQFGPDGMLYLGLGDGGGSNDRFGNGQNTETLLGGIVRIDPASGESELWSYGLRNPYRFWIDGELMYIGDVGQNAYEEIDVVTIRAEGYNFGWPITEALHCFSPRTDCNTDGITLPMVEFTHGDQGSCSVTGGVVYRGDAIPELTGHYLYSDFCGGWLRSLRFDGAEVVDERDWTEDVGVPGNVVSFGVDHTGGVYVLTPNAILRIAPVR